MKTVYLLWYKSESFPDGAFWGVYSSSLAANAALDKIIKYPDITNAWINKEDVHD